MGLRPRYTRTHMQSRRRSGRRKIKAVDLYCGIGGLTHGMRLEGVNVVAGVDNDGSCKYAFEKNNRAKFILKDVCDLSSAELKKIFGKASVKVLIGCAPCQPYSSLIKKKSAYKTRDDRWEPLRKFARLISAVRPHIVSMENVPELSNQEKYPVFGRFVRTLKRGGYRVAYQTVDASRYGVPQKRKRLVLLASLLGDISLISETHDEASFRTVRDAIGGLRRIKDGQTDPKDPLHRASRLSPLNKKRIAATPKNGGSAKDWRKKLIPKCYKRKSGRSYMASVYGRMRWDDPAPTMTTQCTTLGTGRNGHPNQNRAISLREAAIFQTFPRRYKFEDPDQISSTRIAKQIGNAVPVLLGRAIARSIKRHIRRCA
jgi:DNA (cytosine-5)-methyltransferase 1